ncbi:hypothetical protein OIU74_024008 [Salix koriyanagi]|uniref:Protein kinase domain-containing protein n=1 Tax=Salix koriyanagi TaxID=2511006 RepID=A0A9Q1ABQ3_9ROSI|nr:hypothetical protein OIU74_024008 [Salix koriyanagi]
MDRTLIWVLPILIFLIFPKSSSEDENVRKALVQFMEKLSAGQEQNDQNRGWDVSSDPCNSTWKGVDCLGSQNVKRIVLNKFNLTGIFDAASVCTAKSLLVLSLKENNISGVIPDEIGNCKRLSHLYVGGNRFTGNIPDTISQLRNLKRLDISNNNFSGELPDMSRIPGLLTFFAENNQISGAIPDFDFSYLQEFSVANNNFSGPIPDVKNKFGEDSFTGNPGLCGTLLSKACPPSPPPSNKKSKHSSADRLLIFSGYILFSVVVLLLFALYLFKKNKSKRETVKVVKKGKVENESKEPSSNSSESKTGGNRSQYSITSAEAGTTSSSLLVLPSPVVKDLKFEDLLRAPAELLGRGKDGSSYKAMLDSATILAVKRMKDLGISAEEFKSRLQRIGQVKHPRVLPPVAFYCSEQEKLLVYAYQQNGSLFKLLHGSQNGQAFDWGSRLNIAASIAETLAYMHEQLQEDGIAHGNLKSTNILFNNKMEPCIGEYGLKTDALGRNVAYSTFKLDVYGYGVVLLELLTGKSVQNNGFDLASWVNSVVREEWTAEVFDRALISEGACEERMVKLLQVAQKCINLSPNERPSTDQISAMINTIKEDEERFITAEP